MYLAVSRLDAYIEKTFHRKITPIHPVVVNNHVCIVRARLGVVDGVNIMLDFGTEGRIPRAQREEMLREIS